MLLGVRPDGNTVVVADDSTTKPAEGEGARHGNHPADIGRLAILNPTETVDLLATLAESHTGKPQTPAPTEPVPTPLPAPQEAAAATEAAPVEAESAAPGTADMPATQHSTVDNSAKAAVSRPNGPDRDHAVAPAAAAVSEDIATPDRASDRTGDAPAASTVDPGPDGADAADVGGVPGDDGPQRPIRVEITVLGAPGIVDGDSQRSPRAKSLELLVYLAVHEGDASAEAILDDLLPDAPASKAAGRLYTYVSDLRAVLRHNGGPGSYVTHPNHRYVLNPDTVDVDLWRMRAAIRDAEQTTDPDARLAALRRAVDTYGGHLAQGYDYEWIEPYREAVRQQALDAYLALADALAGQPAEQLTVLDAAIGHNPYVEDLYQQAMRARAKLGHLDAIRALRRALTRALAEIDAEPGDDTIALADQLVDQLQRPGRRPDLRPAPRPGDGAAA